MSVVQVHMPQSRRRWSAWSPGAAVLTLAACGPSPGAVGSGGGGGTSSGGNASTPTATDTATSTSGPFGTSGPVGSSSSTTTGPTEPPPLPDIPGDLPTVCEDEVVEGRFLRPQIVFVLDQSSSMNIEWTFGGELMSRWGSLYETVQSVTTEFDERADFGAELFPGLGSGCAADNPITVPVAEKNAKAVLAGIPQADDTTAGSTPLGSGVKFALDHLASVVDLAPQVLILIADGGVTHSCPGPNAPSQVIANLEAAFADDIPTYVVAIDPDNSNPGQLEEFAQAGGVPKDEMEGFYRADDGDVLLETIGGIVQEVIGCAVEIGKTPAHPELVEVTIDGKFYPRIQDCDAESGWMYGDTFESLVLCNQACTDLEDSGIIDIALVCP